MAKGSIAQDYKLASQMMDMHSQFMALMAEAMRSSGDVDDFSEHLQHEPDGGNDDNEEEIENEASFSPLEDEAYDLREEESFPPEAHFDCDDINLDDPRLGYGFSLGLPNDVYVNFTPRGPADHLLQIVNGKYHDAIKGY